MPIAALLPLLTLCLPTAGQSNLDVTTRISEATAGAQPDSVSWNERISRDGRFVVFTSHASNLVPGDTNNVWDVFLRDRLLGTTERVSLDSLGNQLASFSDSGSVSADGRFVLFGSADPNVTPGDTDTANDGFLRDRLMGTVTRVTKTWTGAEFSSTAYDLVMTPDARFIAWTAQGTDLVPGITNVVSDVFVRDRLLGTLERVSVSTLGTEANLAVGRPSISDDGRFVTFVTKSTTLDPTDFDVKMDVFLRDRTAGTTESISDGLSGAPSDGACDRAMISGDGNWIAFSSNSTNLIPNDSNAAHDVFVFNRVAQTIERVSLDSYEQQTLGTNAFAQPQISHDGHFVLMKCDTSMGVPTDTNVVDDLFLRDVWAGVTQRASLTSAGAQGGLAVDGQGSISANAETVVFNTWSAMTTSDTNSIGDVFARDFGQPGPLLTMTPLISAQPTTIRLLGATPAAPIVLAWNIAGQGEVPSPWGIADLAEPFFVLPWATDISGVASLTIGVPPGLTGLPIWIQALDVITLDLSNSAAAIIQ